MTGERSTWWNLERGEWNSVTIHPMAESVEKRSRTRTVRRVVLGMRPTKTITCSILRSSIGSSARLLIERLLVQVQSEERKKWGDARAAYGAGRNPVDPSPRQAYATARVSGDREFKSHSLHVCRRHYACGADNPRGLQSVVKGWSAHSGRTGSGMAAGT